LVDGIGEDELAGFSDATDELLEVDCILRTPTQSSYLGIPSSLQNALDMNLLLRRID
jgi:hypothetical protein